MEWQYTRTELDMEAAIVAQAITPGTRIRRMYRRGVVGKAALYLVLYAAMLLLIGPQMGANWLMLPLCLMACVVLACLFTLPVRRYAKGQVRRFRLAHQLEGMLGANTVTLDEAAGELRAAPAAAGKAASVWRCPLAGLARAQSVCGGVLITCQDGRGYFIPPTAFAGAEGMEKAIADINAAIARAKAAPPKPEGNAVPPGYTATPQGCTLRYTLGEDEARRLFRQMSFAAYRLPATYRRNWFMWVLFLALFVYELWLSWVLAVLMVALLAAGVAWAAWHPKGLEAAVGEQTLELDGDTITVTRGGGSARQPYSHFSDVLETKDAYFPCNANDGGALFIPKSAFADGQEQQAFAALLRARIRANGSLGRL